MCVRVCVVSWELWHMEEELQPLQTRSVWQTSSSERFLWKVHPVMLTVHPSLRNKQPPLRAAQAPTAVLTGSRWRYRARSGRRSVLSPSSPRSRLRRDTRANTRPSTALGRWHRGEGNPTNRSTTDPHAFSPRRRFRWWGRRWIKRLRFVYSGRRLLMWSFRLRWSPTDAFQKPRSGTFGRSIHSRAPAEKAPVKL